MKRALRILWTATALAYPLLVHLGLSRWVSREVSIELGPILLKSVPIVVSTALLVVFGSSLYAPQTFVERIARLQEPDLGPQKVRYCRNVTRVWCGFFVLNIAITLGLAVAAPLSWWTLYTGVVAYALMGLLFVGEYVVRHAKFRGPPPEAGAPWHDRVLATVFPPKDPDAAD